VKTKDYTTSFTVDQSPEEAFDAINNVRGWWSEEVIPSKKVVWLVVDNDFNFTEDKSEWKGTTIIFEIFPKGYKSEIRFTHLGLVPEYQCFEVCSNAWGSYMSGSLRSLITTGKGKPNQKERGSGKTALL